MNRMRNSVERQHPTAIERILCCDGHGAYRLNISPQSISIDEERLSLEHEEIFKELQRYRRQTAAG